MSYQDRLCAHLAKYKRSSLGIQEPGLFKYRGEDVLRDHILPLQHADLNLLPLARSLERTLGPRVHRHQYFHHLNSSQAFAFNLFLPFFTQGGAAASALLRALGQDSCLKSWELEAVPVENEGSNIDASWVSSAGDTTFCEVKLSEAEFGKAVDDERHRDKLATIYRPILQGHVDVKLLDEVAFFEAYQVLRNVWHLVRVEGSALLFLLPRGNVYLWTTLPQILAGLTDKIRSRVGIVAIEDAIANLEADASCPTELRAYAGELKAKYIPG